MRKFNNPSKAVPVDFAPIFDGMGISGATDVDHLVERNGTFLLGDWKYGKGDVNEGQKIALRWLLTRLGYLHGFYFVANHNSDGGETIDPNMITAIRFTYLDRNGTLFNTNVVDCDLAQLRKWHKWFWDFADHNDKKFLHQLYSITGV